MAKFDTPEQLPTPLKNAGYTLIPTKNGQYHLARGNLFVELPTCSTKIDFSPTTDFPLETMGRGSSESQYIDQAFNTGLLPHFLNIRGMYLTIRGREYTKAFTFQLSGIAFNIASVQIEVDAGYEAIHNIILVEAKIGLPKHFNVRQMYYPYRHFSTIVPQKRVRNVFLAYDIPSTSYYLYEYSFDDFRDPLSNRLTQCAIYKLGTTSRLVLQDLIDIHYKTSNYLVPQADDLNKVFELLSIVDRGINNAVDVADYFVFESRQSSYYREAAEYLGLLTNSRDSGYFLTDLGINVLSEPPQHQALIFARVVINSWIFVALIEKAGRDRVFTNNDIDAVIANVQNPDGTYRYTGSTVARRRRTIVAWIIWLAREIGCFAISNDYYILQ